MKDAEDVKGDKAGDADTVPIRIGIQKTARLAFFSTVIAVLTSFIPYIWWGICNPLGILLIDIILLIAAFRGLKCPTPNA